VSEQPPIHELDPDDDVLMDELRALAAANDPVPPHVLAAARGSYTWRTIDAELAGLVYDSALDAERLTAVRSQDTVRLLTFETAELAIELEVTAAAESRRILGQLVPPGPGFVELRHGGGLLELEADDLGRFDAEAVEPGPVSLRCRREREGAVVETEWVTI
jgi:hypothetical protein